MKDQLLRRLAELARARRTPSPVPPRDPPVDLWNGRAVFGPWGRRLGHVTHVRPDGLGGAWLEVTTDWGVLDWLTGMGAGHPRFTFHSEDMDVTGDHELVLKKVLFEHEKDAA